MLFLMMFALLSSIQDDFVIILKDVCIVEGKDLRIILGRNLKSFRGLRATSQADLAEKAGISIIFLSDIERSNKWPSLDTLVSLASALKIEAYELLKPETKEVLSQNSINLLTKYTEEAAFVLSQSLDKLVTHSLKNLRNRYIGDQVEGK
jgi:transcriptional regulator with XRE-family HTH domain